MTSAVVVAVCYTNSDGRNDCSRLLCGSLFDALTVRPVVIVVVVGFLFAELEFEHVVVVVAAAVVVVVVRGKSVQRHRSNFDYRNSKQQQPPKKVVVVAVKMVAAKLPKETAMWTTTMAKMRTLALLLYCLRLLPHFWTTTMKLYAIC